MLVLTQPISGLVDTVEHNIPVCIGRHDTLQKYHGTGTRYFAKISTTVLVLGTLLKLVPR